MINKRKGYKLIRINDKLFQYVVSLSTMNLIVYMQDNKKYVWPLIHLPIFNEMNIKFNWRGKHKEASWGSKKIIRALITHYTKKPSK